MEPSQFDEFTKALATPTSRRQALKRLVAGTFGGLLALSGIGTAFASKCPPGLTDCGGKCVDTKKDPNNCGVCGTKCKSGLCVNGLCCPPGAIQCGNSCCSFTCQNGQCVCVPLEQTCTASRDCCDRTAICDTDTCFSGKVCCFPLGHSCTDNCQCCEDWLCIGGVCVRP